MWTVVRNGMLGSVCRDCNMNPLSSGFQGLGRVFRRSQTHMRAERAHRRLVFRTSRVGSTELESLLHVARSTRSSNRVGRRPAIHRVSSIPSNGFELWDNLSED